MGNEDVTIDGDTFTRYCTPTSPIETSFSSTTALLAGQGAKKALKASYDYSASGAQQRGGTQMAPACAMCLCQEPCLIMDVQHFG